MTAFELASRYRGEITELPEDQQHPLIQWWHMLCQLGPDQPDEVPWCSSFVNGIAWELRLPRSKSARARSWLDVGVSVPLAEAQAAYDVVVLKRGINPAAGHVGFFAGTERNAAGELRIRVLGGNHGNGISIASFSAELLLGVRRLA